MNKKVLTLCAGFLLAGGLVNFANAEVDLAGAAKDGGYYYVRVLGETAEFNKAVEEANVLSLANGVLSHTSDVTESDALMWTVEETTVNGTTVYALKNKAGQYLCFTTPEGTTVGKYDADAKVTYFTAQEGENVDQLQVYGVVNGFLAYNGTDIVVDTWNSSWSNTSTKNLALSLQKVGSNVVSASELNAYLGSTAGFKIQIGNLTKANDDNSFVAYTNLSEGNPFDGILVATKGELKSTTTDQAYDITTDGTTSYFLRKGSATGDYIVLLNKKWDNFNTDHDGTSQKGYKFAVVSEKQLKEYLAKDAYNVSTPDYTPIVKAVKFAISESVNSKYLEVVAIDTGNTEYELLVSSFGNQTVLTTDASEDDGMPSYATSDHKTYVKFGAGNVVNPQDFVKKDSYYTIVQKKDGKVLSVDGCNKVAGFYSASEVQEEMPEGMWALVYNPTANTYTFTNREADVEAGDAFVTDANELYVVDASQNLYEWGGVEYIITTTAIEDLLPGYADLDVVNTKYVAGVYSPIHGNSAWFVENHGKTHQIGLDSDEDNATVWTLVKNNRASEVDPITDLRNSTDSLYVIHDLSYYDTADKAWKTTTDTLKAISYKFVNEYNEALFYDSSNKVYSAKEKDAKNKVEKNFVLKRIGDYYNMVEVTLPREDVENGHAAFAKNKVYGGDSAEKGLLAQTCVYERIENDIIEVKPVSSPMYRRIVNDLDTISIFRNDNNKSILFEDGQFLGMENLAQYTDIAPAMVADTAYVRYNTYRPQYMLVVDPDITPAGMWCEEHQSSTCAHAVPTKGWIEGRYLVNLKDTAIAYDEIHQHPSTNPYVNSEKYYRLGFVQAKHLGDSLIIAADEPTAADTINVGTPAYNVAKFTFRYVDTDAQSFVIETADYNRLNEANPGVQKETYGYLKWMNGVVVVVDNIENADVYNMNEEEEGNPTANETITANSAVTVVATDGGVIVRGAEGKNVIVSTILGKVVANEVINSDNETIAAPAGIVVVSIDGESFKVAVK